MGLIKPLYFIAKTRRERYPYCCGEFRSGGRQVGISRPAGAGLRASEVVEPERPRGVWGRPSPQYKMKKSLADNVCQGLPKNGGDLLSQLVCQYHRRG